MGGREEEERGGREGDEGGRKGGRGRREGGGRGEGGREVAVGREEELAGSKGGGWSFTDTLFYYTYILYMYMIERQGKGSQLHPKTDFFFQRKKCCLSGTRTHDILHTMQMLYQLSHQGSSAGQAESLRFMQGQRCPLIGLL